MRALDDATEPVERGFGLVEVLVSMGLLLIVALSLLPIFVSSLRLSAVNVSLTTATQLVSQQMDLARGLPATCDAIMEYANDPLGRLIPDPKGNVLEIHRETVTACPATYPSALTFRAWVTLEGSNEVIAEAETRIHITSKRG